MATRQKNVKHRQIIFYLAKILLPLLLVYILFRYKPVIPIMVFVLLDIIKLQILRKRFNQFPLDLVFVFGIAIAYYYSFLPSILVFILGILNRMQVEHIQGRHVTKCIRHFTLFFLASLLNFYQFFTLAAFLLLVNYVVKYGLALLDSDDSIYEKSIYHIFNFTSSLILFFIIGIVFQSFPSLV